MSETLFLEKMMWCACTGFAEVKHSGCFGFGDSEGSYQHMMLCEQMVTLGVRKLGDLLSCCS